MGLGGDEGGSRCRHGSGPAGWEDNLFGDLGSRDGERESSPLVAGVPSGQSSKNRRQQQDWKARKYGSKEVQGDEAIKGAVRKVMEWDGRQLREASEEMKGDRDIVMAAVQQDCNRPRVEIFFRRRAVS